MTDALSAFVEDTCKIGQGSLCCRYLAAGSTGFCCLKLTSHKSYVDFRVSSQSMSAQADNCAGKPGDAIL